MWGDQKKIKKILLRPTWGSRTSPWETTIYTITELPEITNREISLYI